VVRLHFHVADPLGTRRVQTNVSGTVETYFVSLPFGDGYTSVSNPNCATANHCYSGDDGTEHHFTGKERDSESGNDYFGARCYGSSMGRMLSPDPSAGYYADPTNPLSLNLYAYVLNNPLANIDPTGLDCVTDNGDGTATTNTGDCANENEAAANAEHYIDCDGCTSGAAGAHLDLATGDLYLTDANGNGMAGTTVQGFADPQGVSTDVTVNGNNQIVRGGGYGVAGFLNSVPYANLPMLPNLSVRDPNAPPSLPKLKGKDNWLCLWGGMTNEMMGGDSGPSDSSDTAPGKGGAEPVRKVNTYKNGNSRQVGPKMGVDEGSGAKADGYVLFGNYFANALA
jgi:RHS repeat-associated protein